MVFRDWQSPRHAHDGEPSAALVAVAWFLAFALAFTLMALPA